MNKNKYWFKRRRYGYGWVPVTFYGWLIIALFLVVLFSSTYILRDAPEDQWSPELGRYLLIVLADVIFLFGVGMVKGPTPKWRWGKKPTDNPEEDF